MKILLFALALVISSAVQASEPEPPQEPGCAAVVASAKTTASGDLAPWRIPALLVQAPSVHIKAVPLGPVEEATTETLLAPVPVPVIDAVDNEITPTEPTADLPVPGTPEALAAKYLRPELGHFKKQSLTAPVEAREIWDASADTQSALVIGESGKSLFFLDWQSGMVKESKSKFARSWLNSPCDVGSVYSLASGDFFVFAFRRKSSSLHTSLRFTGTKCTERNTQGTLVANLENQASLLVQNRTKPYFYTYKEGETYLVETPIGAGKLAHHSLMASPEFYKVDWTGAHLALDPAAGKIWLISSDFSKQAAMKLNGQVIYLGDTGINPGSSHIVKAGQSESGDWFFGMDYQDSSALIRAVNPGNPTKSGAMRIQAASKIHQALVVDDGKLALLATERNGIVLYDLVQNKALADRLWDSPPEVLRIRQTENGTILYWGPSPGRVPSTIFVHLSPLEIPVPNSSSQSLEQAPAKKIERRVDLHAETISVSQELNRIIAALKDPWDASSPSAIERLREPLAALRRATQDLFSLRERSHALDEALGSELREKLAAQQTELEELGKLDPEIPRARHLKLTSRVRYNAVTSLQENREHGAAQAITIDELIMTTSDGAQVLEKLQRELSASVEEAGSQSNETRVLEALNKINKEIGETKR